MLINILLYLIQCFENVQTLPKVKCNHIWSNVKDGRPTGNQEIQEKVWENSLLENQGKVREILFCREKSTILWSNLVWVMITKIRWFFLDYKLSREQKICEIFAFIFSSDENVGKKKYFVTRYFWGRNTAFSRDSDIIYLEEWTEWTIEKI